MGFRLVAQAAKPGRRPASQPRASQARRDIGRPRGAASMYQDVSFFVGYLEPFGCSFYLETKKKLLRFWGAQQQIETKKRTWAY